MGEPICERWISEAVPGRTFAEVGGLWGTVNEQVTVAASAGATTTTMIDVAPSGAPDDLWQRFRDRAAAAGVTGATCVEGSIDDPETGRRAGDFDVVCCRGVLYHCPDPLHTLRQLRAITRETLILGTVSMPEAVANSAGTVAIDPGAALLVPALNQSQRAVIGQWLRDLGDPGIQADGITHEVEKWSLDNYSAWWWLFTRDHVAALLRVAGFEVEAVASYWEGRATTYRARVVGSDSSDPAPELTTSRRFWQRARR